MWKRELIKNKMYSSILMVLGGLSVPLENDATFFVFTLMIGLPLFFSKENWIIETERKPEPELIEEGCVNELSENYAS